MSKRFGRNQKRRMREQIEALKAQRDINKDYYQQEREAGARNRRIIEETAKVLGRHFCTLDPESIEVQHLDQLVQGWRIMELPPLESYLDSTSASDILTFAQFTERVLPILYGSAQAEQLSKRVHFRFTYQGEYVGYGIDQSTLLSMPKGMAAQRIGREMALHLQGILEAST